MASVGRFLPHGMRWSAFEWQALVGVNGKRLSVMNGKRWSVFEWQALIGHYWPAVTSFGLVDQLAGVDWLLSSIF